MIIAQFGPDGLAISMSKLQADMRIVPEGLAPAEGQRIGLVDGAVSLVWDLRGSSAFGGPDGRTAVRVPDSPVMVGKSWDDLAVLKFDEHPYGLLRAARPETALEKRAREKAEADAAAALEAERRANRRVSAVQIRLAANDLGVRHAIETVVADPETPQEVKDYWEYSTEYHRASPVWAIAAPLISATDEMIDQLFDVAETK